VTAGCTGPACPRRIFILDVATGMSRQLIPDVTSPGQAPYRDYQPVWSRIDR